MTGNKPDLLSCPFCRGKAEILRMRQQNIFFAWCDECEARGDYYDTEEDAAEAWNRRAERTCHVIDHGAVGACSACGAECFGSPEGNKGTYCPNCEAKVVE